MADTVTTELSIEDEPIVDVFGRPAGTRVMATLNDAAGGSLSVSDIADQADVSRKSVYNNLEVLAEYGLIEETDEGWRAIMESDTTQAFMLLRDELIDW